MVKAAKRFRMGKRGQQVGEYTAKYQLIVEDDPQYGTICGIGVNIRDNQEVKRVIIPQEATDLGRAFIGCPNLTDVYIYGERVINNYMSFAVSINETGTEVTRNTSVIIHVPNSMVDAYKADEGWAECVDVNNIVGF